MALMKTFKAIWAEDQKSNQFKLMMEGTLKGETMAKSALTQWDWQRIADLITTSITTGIKPLQADIQILKADVKTLKKDMTNVKEDVKNLKEDMKNVKEDIKAIKECPTIKKELKK